MQVAEIIYLCILIAVIFGLIGWFVGYSVGSDKCYHSFEEVLNMESRVPGRDRVMIHICKKCGKRKITKV